MAKRVSKASLVRRIKALEEEIDDMLSFHVLPVRFVTHAQAEKMLREDARFIPVQQYAQRYCLHDGEIGQGRGTRYCLKRNGHQESVRSDRKNQ